MANPNSGRFTWHELMSTDPAKASKFYLDLFGWKTEEVPMGEMGTYRLFSMGGERVAGGMAAQGGQPSAWLVYVGSENPDATCTKVKELGGKIVVPPTDVPNMVRFSVATDPQGAFFGVLKGLGPDANNAPYDGPPRIGHFVWDELHTKDQDAAKKFYGAIFGWTGKVGEGDPMAYWHWQNASKDIGGMMNLMQPNIPPHWLAYVAVADVDASTKKAKDLGAKVHMEPMDIPKTGKFSVIADPTGAAVALFRSARV
jgi:uncharacterized protein